MKKIISLATAIFLFGGFLFAPTTVDAVNYTRDQYCIPRPETHDEKIINEKKAEQTFTPTQNRLGRVKTMIATVYTLDGDTEIKLSVVTNTGQTIASKTLWPEFFGQSWITWNFNPEVTLSLGSTYKLRMEKVSGPGNVYWFIDIQTCYANGGAFVNDLATTFDFNFQTYGYTYAPPGPSDSSSQSSSNAEQTNTNQTNGNTIGDSGVSAAAALTEDAGIKGPNLTYIEKSGKKTDAPIKDAVFLGKKDKLKAVGTSFAGAEVALFVGDRGYLAETDANGNWSIDLPTSEFREGEIAIMGQSQIGGKGSVKKELFKVKVLGAKSGSGASAVKSWFDSWNIFCTLTGIGILLMVLMLLLLIAKRHKDNLGKVASNKKTK